MITLVDVIYSRHRDGSLTGILIVMATFLAMLASNTSVVYYYQLFLHTKVALVLGEYKYYSTLHYFINDALMPIFFFYVGLELKHEMLRGNLNTTRKAAFPLVSAIGGMLLPALIYLALNFDNPVAYRGWAIPTATDIAFALGVLTLVGDAVPHALKVFLTALAVFDDLGAILIIAFFYSTTLNWVMLMGAAFCIMLLICINRSGIEHLMPYLMLSFVLWLFILYSGVHPTVTGVIAALSIPLIHRVREHKLDEIEDDNLVSLYDKLHPGVCYLILPLFAFANAGVNLQDIQFHVLFSPVLLGIVAGLCVGKPLGITLFAYLGNVLGWASLPEELSWMDIIAVAFICGVGFTMSLFIGELAFEHYEVSMYPVWVKSGVLLGSLISCIFGYCILKFSLRNQQVSV